MKELVIEAKIENLNDVIAFLDEQLELVDCPIKIQMQMDIAVEEIYINIASYAYEGKTGDARIQIDTDSDPGKVLVTFYDTGIPYNPLAKEDPDVTLSADERQIGGLGIFMVKKSMDDMKYEYKDGQNILTLIKKLSE